MSSSASDAPVTKSESAPAVGEVPAPASGAASSEHPAAAAPSTEQPAAAASSGEQPAAAASSGEQPGAPVAASSGEQPAAPPSDSQLAEAGQGALPDQSEASVTKEEMERYIKISRDLKLRRGSLMPPGGTLQSGKNLNATTTASMPLCTGAKKKPNLMVETRIELYGRGRVKFSCDGVSEDAGVAAAAGGAPQQQPVAHPDESATSLVKRGGPSTAITPRRLSLEERAPPPPPTPAPSIASLHNRSKSIDFGTIPLKDDDHPEPSNPP